MALGDVLLARFKHAVAQSLPPASCNTAAVAEALDALALLAAHAEAAPLLESLLAWRTTALGCGRFACEAVAAALTPCCRDAGEDDRRVVMLEAAFWDAVVALICEGESAGRPPPAHVSEALEGLAFDALLAAAALPPAEDGTASPLSTVAHARAEAAARAFGRLSLRRFEPVSARLLQELEARLRFDTSVARAEMAALAGALRCMHLPVRKSFTHVALSPLLLTCPRLAFSCRTTLPPRRFCVLPRRCAGHRSSRKALGGTRCALVLLRGWVQLLLCRDHALRLGRRRLLPCALKLWRGWPKRSASI